MLELLAVFVVIARLSVFSHSAADRRKNRLSNQKCHLAGELPTRKRDRGLRFWFSRNGCRGVFNQTSAFADTFGWDKAGGNTPENGGNLFRKL